MMAWSSGEANQKSQARSMDTGDSSHQLPPAPEPHPHHLMLERDEDDDDEEEEEDEEEDVEEAEDVLRRVHDRVICIGAFDDEEDEDDDESSYRLSSVDEACVSKTESSCPSSADSLGLDSMRRSLSPRHHPLLSPMHMGKSGQPPRQVSPARSDAGVSTSSRAGCKRSVSSAINGKELLSLPPSHSLPVSPLLHRKFFASRSPQRSFSHSRMAAGRSLTRLCETSPTVVTISAPPHSEDEDDEQRRRMRDILQNLPLAEIYKKRARRNNQGGLESADSTPGMEVLVHTPQETPPLSASSSGRHNFKKALRDRYLLSQSGRGGGSHGGSSSSQDSAASGGKIPLDLTSERFTKIREPLKSETEDLISPHPMMTDDTNPNSPMAPSIPSILQHPPPHNLSHHPLHLSSHGGSMGDDDAFYPAAAVAVQLIARTCRIESSSSSYLSIDMDSDPFSPMSPMSPCMISPKQQPTTGHHLTPTQPPSHHLLQPGPTSGPWIQPASVPSIGVPRGGAPFISGPPPGPCHPGAIPIQRQCQSAPQTPHSSPQIRSHFFFPPQGAQMPPPPQPSSTLAPTSTLSSPALSPGSEGRPERVSHACPVCSRSFSRSDMLSRHMRLHTGLKPYECASCGQSFSRSDHLNTHIRTHTGEKPYHCPQCSYSACRRDMITRHMKVHRRKLTARDSAPVPEGGGDG